jgi:FtsP/CotA-like multicopper oxidase with cupredoxin domain
MSARVLVATVLAVGIVLGAVAVFGGGGPTGKVVEVARAADSMAPFVPGLDFAEPPAVRSSHGRLKATLVAQTIPVPVSGVTIHGTQAYSAKWKGGTTKPAILGPTLHARPGDTVELTLDNRLTVPEDSTEKAACTDTGHHHGSTHTSAANGALTNVHFHGFHVTPRDVSPFGDTVLVHLGNGKWRYHFKIPKNHDRGTFWYHAHVHECTNDEVTRGLAGLFYIGDSRKDLPKRFRKIKTRSIALKDVQTVPVPNTSEVAVPPTWKIDPALDFTKPTQRTVNGLVNPKMTIRPGETQMWRILNASAGVWYKVVLADAANESALDRFTVVAQDGNSLRHAVKQTTLLIPNGARFDILVHGPASGTRVLKTLPFDQGFGKFPEATLATLEVQGPATKPLGFPEKLTPPHQIFPKKRGPTRTFVFDLDLRDTQFSIGKNSFNATINNADFDPKSPAVTPVLGTTERWIILNKSAEWHPFHIHQNDFRIVKWSRPKDLPPLLPGDHDIVALPPGTPPNPSVTEIDMPFTDYAGNFVFHCHILDHEDAGMMSLIELRPPKLVR